MTTTHAAELMDDLFDANTTLIPPAPPELDEPLSEIRMLADRPTCIDQLLDTFDTERPEPRISLRCESPARRTDIQDLLWWMNPLHFPTQRP